MVRNLLAIPKIRNTRPKFSKLANMLVRSLVMNYVMSHFFCSPAGWDNEKKVAILYENMHSVNPDHYYTDVIARPMIRKVVY